MKCAVENGAKGLERATNGGGGGLGVMRDASQNRQHTQEGN